LEDPDEVSEKIVAVHVLPRNAILFPPSSIESEGK